VIKSGYQDKEKTIQKKGVKSGKPHPQPFPKIGKGVGLRRFRKVSFGVTFM